MLGDGLTVTLEGVDEMKRALAGLAPKVRKKAVRGALKAAGKVIRDAARQAAPVLKSPARYRKSGTVRRAITVRTSKAARKAGNEGVFVSVRPLRGARQTKLGKAGAKNPNDPFYWWFQEFGWTPRGKVKKRAENRAHARIPGKRFMTNAAEQKGRAAIQAFMQAAVPQIEKLNK